ncbi:hypothetical protein B9Z55_003545 [Caenorhabditis nigoni]|uniref:Uncharacterized protein n=1 Tax=Caenorhabditis nigoni TaxID=1611254 RepID=A0A2G5VQZ3_9PELO|nr:hypothetical protein B9Z55_003545 [Caenorhabditis nigoni]
MDPYHYSPLPQEPSPPQKKYLQLPGMEDDDEGEECDFVFWLLVLLMLFLAELVMAFYPLINYSLGYTQNPF